MVKQEASMPPWQREALEKLRKEQGDPRTYTGVRRQIRKRAPEMPPPGTYSPDEPSESPDGGGGGVEIIDNY